MIFKSANKWFFTLILIFLVFFGSICLINYKNDWFGVFNSNSQVKINTYGSGRYSKAMLSLNYIPSNFNTILVGTSATESIDLEGLVDGNGYNLSFSGSNISEQIILLNNILNSSNNINLVILTIHPYLTKDYGPKSQEMDSASIFSALASTQLFEFGLSRFLDSSKDQYMYGHNGTLNYKNLLSALTPSELSTYTDPLINENALNDYKFAIELIRESNINIIILIPPIFSKDGSEVRKTYNDHILSFFNDEDNSLNLNKYNDLLSDPKNFSSKSHLTRQGSIAYSKILVDHINELKNNKI